MTTCSTREVVVVVDTELVRDSDENRIGGLDSGILRQFGGDLVRLVDVAAAEARMELRKNCARRP